MKAPISALLSRALLLPVLVSFTASPARADFDPEDDRFDPEKIHTITADGAFLGDPSPFVEMDLERVGYTYTSQALVAEAGVRVMVSLMIPLREGETVAPGGGALSLTLEEAKAFSAALRKGREWAGVAKENEVGEYSKEIDRVQGGDDEAADGVSLVFLADADSEGSVVVEQRLAGVSKRYRFSINAAAKLAEAVDHFAAQAKELHGKPGGTPLPKGDAERDALFQ